VRSAHAREIGGKRRLNKAAARVVGMRLGRWTHARPYVECAVFRRDEMGIDRE
jgi:hypothetical protein